MKDDFQITLIDNGVVLQNHAFARRFQLVKYADGYQNKFMLRDHPARIFGRRIENTNVWVCMGYPVTLWAYLNAPIIILLIITLLSAVSVIILFRFIWKNLLVAIRQLSECMERIGRGEEEEILQAETKFYEIQKTYEALRYMTKELKKQQQRLAEEAVEREKAQMQYLQLQLKPHFYLNGLKTVNALAVAKKTDRIQELVVSLSEHIRYLLQLDHETVRLEEEVKFVENYISLQKHVTGRIVCCSIAMDPGTESIWVPVLCIQTFVENSIKYAKVGSVRTPLEIEVRLELLETEDGDYLDIVVTDNGQGYSPEVLEDINSESVTNGSNIGINNIKRRCRILYGKRAEFYFDNCSGAVSELIFPMEVKIEK